jgi:hypothetical protein
MGLPNGLLAMAMAACYVALTQGAQFALFEAASPHRWLTPTTLVLQAKAQSDARHHRSADDNQQVATR